MHRYRTATWALGLGIAALGGLLSACDYSDAPAYDFRHPRSVHTMPPQLGEISGLTPLDWQYAAGVEDETGRYYIIDMTKGKVVRVQKFGDDGDYEDLVRIGPSLYILEGNGMLHIVRDLRSKNPQVRRVPTGVANAEGLAWDGRKKLLLIGGVARDAEGAIVGAVYGFNLRSERVTDEPLLTIPIERVRAMASKTDPVTGLDEPAFKPSALAVQPSTRDVYLLSAKVHALLVVSPGGEMKRVYTLPPHIYHEPEGIAFLPNGELFISNEEKRDAPATLIRLKHRRSPF